MKKPDPTARLDIALMKILSRTVQPNLTAHEWNSIKPLMESAAGQLQAVVMVPKVKRTIRDLRAAMQTAEETRRARR